MTDVPKEGLEIPERLHAKWQAARANHSAVQSMLDAMLLRQREAAAFQNALWDETFKELGIDTNTPLSVNWVEMKLYLQGQPDFASLVETMAKSREAERG